MTVEMWAVLAILIGAAVLFATEKLPVDLVALLVLCVLLASSLVSPAQGLSGFSSQATITVAAMFVLSAALQRTGALRLVGSAFARWGQRSWQLLVMIILSVATVSAFVNNTAAVAVFLPIVLVAANARKISPSRLLIPLSYASQFGGVCTLIGTSTNLLVHSLALDMGVEGFSMFELGQLGIWLALAGGAFLLLFGRWLLPDRRAESLSEVYQIGEYLTELRVLEGSPVIGRRVGELGLEQKYGIRVIEILRGKRNLWSPGLELLLEGDVLLVQGPVAQLLDSRESLKLAIAPEFKLRSGQLADADVVLVEALVAPRSRFAGQTLAGLDFHWHYNAVALALQRRGQVVRSALKDVRLRFGDALLLLVRKEEEQHLRRNSNLIILDSHEDSSSARRKAPIALAAMAGVVALAATGILPIVTAALLGSAAVVLTGCLKLEEAYEAVDWKVILLLAGVLPLGIAMQDSGLARYAADGAMSVLGDAGPVWALAGIFVITAVLTELMSNNAAAVLLAPIAVSTALALGVDPKPFLVAVTVAASTSFATPVGYQTNTMVYNAGGYRFSDFMRIGIPLNILFAIISVMLIPRIWPF